MPLHRVSECGSRRPVIEVRISSFVTRRPAGAPVGLYGVLSYSVSQRRRELGVRSALGAGREDLVWLVIREGMTVTLIGVVMGSVAALGLTRGMRSLLFGVAPLDPVAFATAPAILLPVALAACLVPALRAARVDPAAALRSD